MPYLGKCSLPGNSLNQTCRKHLSVMMNSRAVFEVIGTFVPTEGLPHHRFGSCGAQMGNVSSLEKKSQAFWTV